METKFKALLALLATVFLWSLSVVIVRAVVVSVSPIILHFLRILIASLVFLPFFLKTKAWHKPQFMKAVLLSLFATGNMWFFMWGIQYTSATASQLIYAFMPILIVIIDSFYHKIRHPWQKITGVMVGFVGLTYILYLSAIEKGITIIGDIKGNLAILVAMFSWLTYIYFSKKLSKQFSPLELSSISIIGSLSIALILFLMTFNESYFNFIFDTRVILASLYVGICGTFLASLLYQYAIKYLPPLTVSLSSYIQPITTAILAIIFLGERLTVSFSLGSILVFSGVFISTTLELYKRRR